MPRLSDSMEDGTIARWLVEEGGTVARGQVLAEIDTDKATMEYESEAEGTLLKILVAAGESTAIGSPIAIIGAPGEAAPQPTSGPKRLDSVALPRASASPVARRLAKELDVDLANLGGTGPDGMISREDVERAARAGSPATAAGAAGLEPLTRVQQAVARHMVEASAVPVFSAEVEIDIGAAVELRKSLDGRPSLNDLVVKACALALREHPRVNASYTEEGFRQHEHVNIGIAVAADDALLVPVIRDADAKPLAAIARETREVAAKARDGKLAQSELEGGTFTVSNLGMFGIRRFEALLNTPQAAILAVGSVERRPVVAPNGAFAAATLMNATLVSDHRILYGADSARFLARVRELLETPASLAG